MTRHIVTGATGFIGGHLLADLLSDPDSTTVYALTRGRSRLTAAERVRENLTASGGTDAGDTLEVLDADLGDELCGVTPESISREDGPLIFWHLAASLQWRRGQREAIFRTNVEGTRHALELAKAAGADLFVYMSTAYTCGTSAGDLAEELHRPPSFNNAYEESKCATEHLVAGFEGVRTLILRPSVVVGTSTDYQPSGSYTGLYGYLSELRRFKDMLGDSDEVVRFSCDRDTRISFIAVDHVVSDARKIVSAELAEPTRSIHHLSGRCEVTVGDICDYMLKLLDLQDRLVLMADEVDEPSVLERMFDKRVEFFSDYMRNEKRFIRSTGLERTLLKSEIFKYIDGENSLGTSSR
jgi:nucleoside-diphosphate-sugar epimerase